MLLPQLFSEFRPFFVSLFFILSFISLRYVSSFSSLSLFLFCLYYLFNVCISFKKPIFFLWICMCPSPKECHGALFLNLCAYAICTSLGRWHQILLLMFPHWLFVHVCASFLTNTYLWMPRTPSPKPVDVPLWCSLVDGPHPQCSFVVS